MAMGVAVVVEVAMVVEIDAETIIEMVEVLVQTDISLVEIALVPIE